MPHDDGMRKCAGVLAQRYDNMGGRVYYYGKPDSKIYDTAIKKLNYNNSNPINKRKILIERNRREIC